MKKFIDLAGQKFGRLTVIHRENNDKDGNSRWLCRCNCGKEKIIVGYSLKGGLTKSCGCLQKEKVKQSNTKHGHNTNKKSRTYQSWISMVQRCINPKCKHYKNYGGRGISVHERWLKFENFLEDMGEAPEGLSIDRINNNLGYSKENCQWATRKEQSRNKRNNRFITLNGQTKCIAEWSEETGIKYDTLFSRLHNGWSVVKTLITPVKERHKK